MSLILCSCKSLCFPKCSLPLNHISNNLRNKPHANPVKLPSPTPQKFCPFTNKFSILGATHVPFCSRNEEFVVDDRIQELETLELQDKPSLVPIKNESFSEIDVHSENDSTEEDVLAPFLKFFKGSNDSVVEEEEAGGVLEGSKERGNESENAEKFCAEYYEPKPGDFVVGVVVSGNENKLNVNVGSELPGTMLTKEVLPLYSKEMEHLLCDVNNAEESPTVQGKIGILKNDDAINGVPVPGGTVVEIGTILFAEVLGRTLAGRPLLSTRRLFRRIAWHRLRQIGRHMHVQVILVDEAENNLILSEREAWEKLNLREGTLLEGTVRKILPYGAQIRIGETNRSGLLHVSNITRAQITSISDILSVDEKVKVLVVKSVSHDKISLSIADLESEPGLFLSNKERVFLEADMMAKKYREKLPPAFISQRPDGLHNNVLPFENEALYANWKWFKFER
eukprot:XP_014624723.1 uncharacterized protein LOC100811564 isoform X3 [Glycine max]